MRKHAEPQNRYFKYGMIRKKKVIPFLIILLILAVYFFCPKENVSMSDIPEYSGSPSVEINQNDPSFTDDEFERAKRSYIDLSELDWLGRCGECEMSVSQKDLPTGERGDISSVHPTGWRQAFYPDLISKNNGALYNRCHLLMCAMSGLNDDERNLITGTVYLNIDGMLPYETAARNYVNSGNRIIYRVTPVFEGNDLVAKGVQIEAADVRTKGMRFRINVFCYNVQPGIDISYRTGNSSENGDAARKDNLEIIYELLEVLANYLK